MNTKNINGFIDDFAVYPSRDPRTTVDDLILRLEAFEPLLQSMPKAELKKRGWKTEMESAGDWSGLILDVLSESTRPLFRRSNAASEALSAAWLARISELASFQRLLKNIPQFETLTAQDISEWVKLSNNPNSIIELPELLARKGIILIYEQSLTGMKLDGAVYRNSFGNPVIGISFRYPRLDNFWFTLLHELAHIVLHFDQLETPILDDLEETELDRKEKEANRYAMNLIIPRSHWRNIGPRNIRSNEDVVSFSKKLGVHPALVAGMLQKQMNRYDLFRKLVDQVNTRELVFDE